MNITSTPATITQVVLMLETASLSDGPSAADASAGVARSAPAPTPMPRATLFRYLLRISEFLLTRRPPGPAVAVTEHGCSVGSASGRVFGHRSEITALRFAHLSRSIRGPRVRMRAPNFGPMSEVKPCSAANPSVMAASRLTSLDGSFLRAETENAHMHVAWSGLFEPGLGMPPPSVENLRAKLAARLGRVPRFRQRLAYPPLRLAEPCWIDDPEFDLARHVTAIGDPGVPMSRHGFAHFTDCVLSEPLDR